MRSLPGLSDDLGTMEALWAHVQRLSYADGTPYAEGLEAVAVVVGIRLARPAAWAALEFCPDISAGLTAAAEIAGLGPVELSLRPERLAETVALVDRLDLGGIPGDVIGAGGGGPHQDAARPARRIEYHVAGGRVQALDHQIDQRTRSEELAYAGRTGGQRPADQRLVQGARTVTVRAGAPTARAGAVLVATRGTVGPVAIADTEISLGSGVTAVGPCDEIDPEWMAWALVGLRAELARLAVGTMISGVRAEAFDSLTVRVPPLEDQIEIARAISAGLSALRIDSQPKAGDHMAAAVVAAGLTGRLCPIITPRPGPVLGPKTRQHVRMTANPLPPPRPRLQSVVECAATQLEGEHPDLWRGVVVGRTGSSLVVTAGQYVSADAALRAAWRLAAWMADRCAGIVTVYVPPGAVLVGRV